MKQSSINTNYGTAALYCRLSRDDNMDTESNSIQNQKQLLQKVAKEKGYTDTIFFVDDGVTGTTMNRPGFQKMLSAIEAGYISAVLVKDLSRLGRNYVEVGNLLEQLFPFLGVRVISINDNYDSDAFNGQTGGIDVAFKNLVYNLYSRDLSQKVKSAVTTRMKRGEYIGPFGLFGYKKSPTDIHKLV